ncbi:MAG: DUF6789 family protein [bacterium]
MSSDAAVDLPGLNARTVVLIVLAGVVGELVLEFIAWGIAPVLLGQPMQPAMLVAGLASSLFGFELSMPVAFILHLVAGIVVFPVGYLVFRAAAGFRSPVTAGLVWGVVLWLVAQAILAPLAGRPFMLGFIPYTWAALVAHVIYTLTVALSYEQLSRRAGSGASK